jgi:hypothetical protein
MTSGPHLAAAEARVGRCWAVGRAGPGSGGGKAGLTARWARSRGSVCGLRHLGCAGNWEERKKVFFLILKTFKLMNSNLNLNSNNQEQCSSVYATVNSYISLF